MCLDFNFAPIQGSVFFIFYKKVKFVVPYCTGVCPGAAGPRYQPACAVPLQPATRHRLLQVEGRRQARTHRINICHIRTATRSLSYELSLLYTLSFIYIIYIIYLFIFIVNTIGYKYTVIYNRLVFLLLKTFFSVSKGFREILGCR